MFINLSLIVGFSKLLRQGVPYQTEKWHALSHEQYFSKHRFLDICRCAFNNIRNERVLEIFRYARNRITRINMSTRTAHWW